MTTVEKMLIAPKRLRQAAEAAAEAALAGEREPLLVNQARAARELSCSRYTIRRMEADGKLHPVTIRGLRRYRMSELKTIAEGE